LVNGLAIDVGFEEAGALHSAEPPSMG
jgi:hypothetical protein